MARRDLRMMRHGLMWLGAAGAAALVAAWCAAPASAAALRPELRVWAELIGDRVHEGERIGFYEIRANRRGPFLSNVVCLRPNGAPPLTLQGLTIGGTAYGKPLTVGFWAAAPQPPQRLGCVGEVL